MMLRNLIESLRIRLAVHDHNRRHRRRILKVMPSGAELDAIEALRATGANTQKRLAQAALLEAHYVPENLIHMLHKVCAEGKFTQENLNQLAEAGIEVNFGDTVEERLIGAVQQTRRIGQTLRLQNAVTRLAFIAGPGFTTQQLIDDGLVKEGDL